MAVAGWDLSALLNAADPRAPRAERHLWLVRLIEWLRHGEAAADTAATPRPVLRLRMLLNVTEREGPARERIVALLARLWHESDVAALFADTGFGGRRGLWGEVWERVALRCLPGTPDTDDLAGLFLLLFTDDGDADWLAAIDAPTLDRLAAVLREARAGADAGRGGDWRAPVLRAMTWLVSAVRAAAFAPALRQRMEPALLEDQPFEQLARAADALADAVTGGERPVIARQATYLRALLARCRAAAASIDDHLEAQGVSVDIVFEQQQLQARCERIEALLDLVLSAQPARELQALVAALVRQSQERRSLRALLSAHYALLARKVAERHAETGEHYITRNREEYRRMLRDAAGGGLVLAGTTFAKFGILALAAALGLAPFWTGLGAGLNYAISFLLVQALHWTVATKQPAMTAPAMADKLAGVGRRPGGAAADGPPTAAMAAVTQGDADALAGFVDEVVHLVRSQIAGIVGNLALVAPVVLAVQGLAWWAWGRPLVGVHDAEHVLDSLTLLGPTALFAAFTGVLLFASSVIAGWAENAFVYRRLDSALAHHPDLVARLGAARAARWAAWWRSHVSGVAANVSLGLMLGMVPVLLAFVGLPIEVRHVTLSTGQLAAAASTLGWSTLAHPAFWWCVAGLVITAALNLGVSFWLAFHVALRSRGISGHDGQRIRAALWQRLRQAPRSFVLPD